MGQAGAPRRAACRRAALKVTIVLPTYNEAATLEQMVAALLALPLAGLSVLVVDDNSPDGTGEIAEQLAARHAGQVTVLHRSAKAGLGRAYVAGFAQALQNGADRLVQMDCDFSHSPRFVARLVEQLDYYDVVVGSRYVAGGSLDDNWGIARRLLSWFANSVYTRVLLGLQTRDVTAGFKAWRRDTLLGIGLHRAGSNGYIFQAEMAFLTERLGYRVLELPIYFEDRRIGRSKMTYPVKFEAVWRTLQVVMRHRHLSRADRCAF